MKKANYLLALCLITVTIFACKKDDNQNDSTPTARTVSYRIQCTDCFVSCSGPNGVMRDIHDRMPVILSAEDHDAWLDPRNQSVASLKQLVKPCADSTMAAHAVSTRVNAPKNDDAGLIDPLDMGELDWG
jgi:hypothetical protein